MTDNNYAASIQQHPRILVADDYETNHKLVQLILQKAGYRVEVVENGQQAVENCRQNHYDLILMDIQMPLMDGLKATEAIRKWESASAQAMADKDEMRNQIGKHSDPNSEFRIPTSEFKGVPIIAMTGNGTAGGFDETQYPGMNDCIGKPLQRDLLLSVVQKWISTESNSHPVEIHQDDTRAEAAKPAQNQIPLNLDQAILEFMGQKDILFEVLREFVNKAANQIDTIRQAVKGEDYSAIEHEAHAIKGGAANLRADRLAGLAAALEAAAVEQQPHLIGELADQFEQEFFCLEKYVRQIPDVAQAGITDPPARGCGSGQASTDGATAELRKP